MEKILRLNEQDIIQALADHFNVDRAKVNLTVKIRTEGYGPTEHQFSEVRVEHGHSRNTTLDLHPHQSLLAETHPAHV